MHKVGERQDSGGQSEYQTHTLCDRSVEIALVDSGLQPIRHLAHIEDLFYQRLKLLLRYVLKFGHWCRPLIAFMMRDLRPDLCRHRGDQLAHVLDVSLQQVLAYLMRLDRMARDKMAGEMHCN
jgi:hypothetical protein